MKKLVLTVGCAAAAGSAAVAVGLGFGTGLGTGSANASPGNNNSTLNVVGEPYAKAVAILRAQGVPTVFGGSVGSDLPQAQCVVSSQKVLSTRKMELMLNCTAEEAPQQALPATAGAATSGVPSTEAARPTPGAPGVVTVVPTPVG